MPQLDRIYSDIVLSNLGILKKVVITIEFEGLTSIEQIIETLKAETLATKFGSYRKSITVRESSTGLNEITHTFFDYQSEESTDSVELTLTTEYLKLEITCKNYSDSLPYFSMVIEIMTKILASDTFTVLKNVSLNKVAGEQFDSLESLGKVFKPEALVLAYDTDTPSQISSSEYTDRFIIDKDVFIPVMISYKRMCRALLSTSSDQDDKEYIKYQVLTETTGFANEKAIRSKNISAYPEQMQCVLDDLNSLTTVYTINLLTDEFYHAHAGQ